MSYSPNCYALFAWVLFKHWTALSFKVDYQAWVVLYKLWQTYLEYRYFEHYEEHQELKLLRANNVKKINANCVKSMIFCWYRYCRIHSNCNYYISCIEVYECPSAQKSLGGCSFCNGSDILGVLVTSLTLMGGSYWNWYIYIYIYIYIYTVLRCVVFKCVHESVPIGVPTTFILHSIVLNPKSNFLSFILSFTI